jgi:hypothetical protein
MSTITSIIQQCHTIVDWEDIKIADYNNSVLNLGSGEVVVAGGTTGLDLALFYIRMWHKHSSFSCMPSNLIIEFYAYNVLALVVMCW